MSVDERDRRAAGGREGVQRAPRSGGRTAEQRSPGTTRTPASGRTAGGARGARHFPTAGATALKVDAAQPSRVIELDVKPRLQVAPPAPISVPRAPFAAAVLTLVVAGVFGILLINTKTNENSFQISQLEEQQAVLDNQQQQLQRQIDTFEAPGNLHAAARKLGLVVAQPAYIRMPDGLIINPLIPGRGDLAITAQGNGAQTTGTRQAGTPAADAPANGAAGNGAAGNGAAGNGAAGDGAAGNGAAGDGAAGNGAPAGDAAPSTAPGIGR